MKLSELFCILILIFEIVAFLHFDPIYIPPQESVSEDTREFKSIYGDSILLHLPKKQG